MRALRNRERTDWWVGSAVMGRWRVEAAIMKAGQGGVITSTKRTSFESWYGYWFHSGEIEYEGE